MSEETYLSDFAAQEWDLEHKGLYFWQGEEPMFLITRATVDGFYVKSLNQDEAEKVKDNEGKVTQSKQS